jgi:hypothetical protein
MTRIGMRLARYPGRALALALLLSACGGSLPPPDWQLNARGAIEAYEKYYLGGDGRLAELNFAKAREAIAASGRPDILARAELARCATRVAALVFEDCADYRALEADAVPAERAYARFLAGDWASLEVRHLPEHYAALLGAREDAARLEALDKMRDPRARLIGAALLFKQTLLPPAGIAMAIDTASERGWRRPLLAWLRVAEKRAEATGDAAALAGARRRIDLVLAAKPAMREK